MRPPAMESVISSVKQFHELLSSVKQRRGSISGHPGGNPPTRTVPPRRHRARCKDHSTFMTHDAMDPLAAFAELGRTKLSENSLDDVLNRVASVAQRMLP